MSSAAYRAAHRDEIRASSSAYYATHRAEKAAYDSVYAPNRRAERRAAKEADLAARSAEIEAERAARRQKKREERRVYHAAYHAEHRDKKRTYDATYKPAWRRAHPTEAREQAHRSEVRRRGGRSCNHASCLVVGPMALAWQTNEHVCHICGAPVIRGPGMHMDHVLPIARGGLHCADNLRPACAACNQRKGAKSIEEYVRVGLPWLEERKEVDGD